jgi:predicted RNA-binding protein with PUA-like domain
MKQVQQDIKRATMNYWIMKSEPKIYNIDDLAKDKVTYWNGIRNYQARNFMMHRMNVEDEVFFYHSNADVIGITGVMSVCSKAYPDESALDKNSRYYDSRSTKEKPIWFMVDVKFKYKFKKIITLNELKKYKETSLDNFKLLAKGNRLSILPVEKNEWEFILKLN